MNLCDRLQVALLGVLLLFGASATRSFGDSSTLSAAFSFDTVNALLTDSSGNENTGTLGPAVSSTSGKYAAGLAFNGTDYVTIHDSDSLDVTTELTLEAWVNPSAPIKFWSTVLLKEQPGFLAYGLFAGTPGGRPAFYITTPTLAGVEGTTALPLNTWSHLAATYDGTALRLYVNGAEVGSNAASGNIVTSSEPLRIGGNAIWPEYFTGAIDEVRVYRRALSVSEINADITTPVSNPTTGPPTIAAQPRDQTVTFGHSAIFNVIAGGAPPLSYQWYFDGTNPVESATNNQLLLANVNDSKAGLYSVNISNSYGSISSGNARLYVNHPPVVVSPELARYPGAGFTVRDIQLFGSDPDGDPVTLRSIDSISQEGGLVTASAGWVTYVPPAGLTTEDRFNYTVIDYHGAVSSDAATIVTVNDQLGPQLKPPFVSRPSGRTFLVGEGLPWSGYVLESIEDLLNPNWQRIGFVETDDRGVFVFTDPVMSSTGNRLYRMALPGGDGRARTYGTEFTVDENPISDFGNWINGKVAGLDWSDVATTNGIAIGLQPGFGGFDDATALLSGTWGPDQSVSARVYLGKRPAPGVLTEVEFRLRSSLSPYRNDGYEVLFSLKGDTDCYISIVRWNGPVGDWTALEIWGGSQYVINDGDEVAASITGNVIRGYIRGVKVMEVTDDTFTFGSPGIGFYLYGADDAQADFGFKNFTATDMAPANP